MAHGFQPQAEQITRSEHQCKHCGSWLNKAGYMDDTHRTAKATYCPTCNTAPARREVDKQNEEIKKERGDKK